MSEKSIVREAKDIRLAMELITLGARLQMLESETQLSRGRLIKLYKELRGSPPPKRNVTFFNGLVYDMGTKYPFLNVL
ncbi:transcriptional activator FlhC [Proteus vulgaris]|nr:transcriptional activator FlhC [Proteus vulgaris]